MAEKEYIERNALKNDGHSCWHDGKGNVYYEIDHAPAADVVEVVHARWDEDEYPFCNVCMECGLVIDRTCIKHNSGKLNFCPHCGAKMDGERKEATP